MASADLVQWKGGGVALWSARVGSLNSGEGIDLCRLSLPTGCDNVLRNGLYRGSDVERLAS
jgi:hypothetical protein